MGGSCPPPGNLASFLKMFVAIFSDFQYFLQKIVPGKSLWKRK